MRIFTRLPKESIAIGPAVIVTVLEIRGSQVRIGISAPRDIDIQREEIIGTSRARNPQAKATG